MGPPPSEPGGDSIGPPDRQTLRLLERQLAADELVVAVAFDPDPYEPRLLRATLDRDSYPDSVTAVRLDVRWFTTGDFSIHYVESRGDDRWECRWDRHPNAHNARVNSPRGSSPGASCFYDALCTHFLPVRRERRERSLHRR